MGKGQATRQLVLDRATELARTVGLEGLTIGKLAEELRLSKSGLFAHFRSKENLQVDVIQEARKQFVETVVAPALRKPRGEPRVRALFERWLEWGKQAGGCFFIAAAVEFDDREGVARDAAVAAHRDWLNTLSRAAHIAVEEGHFKKDLDVQQFAFEVQSIMLGGHLLLRFLRDPHAIARARRTFEALLQRTRR